MFYKHFKEAQAAVPEPSQAKIKLKVGQNAETPTPSKKITIHVGGRGGSADSPAVQAASSADTPTNAQDLPADKSGMVNPAQPAQLIKTRSASGMASPSPSLQQGHLKAEDSARMSPAVPPQLPTPTGGQAVGMTPGSGMPPMVQPQQPPPVIHSPLEQKRLRGAGKGIPLSIPAHPQLTNII
jgi:hypothetical protein